MTGRLLRCGLAVAWMALIYRLSDTPGLRVLALLDRLLAGLGAGEVTLQPAGFPLLESLLRKGAHVAAYAVLAVLVYRALAALLPTRGPRRLAACAFAIAVLYAATDEWHQALVPARDGKLTDVLIDAAGAWLGLRWLHYGLRQRARRAMSRR